MTIEERLKNKTVVITGASSGAGRAAALEFATQGVYLVLAARNKKALEEVASACRELGAEALVVPTDVTQNGAMIHLANTARDWKGTLDVWINNAGVLAAGPFEETPMVVHQRAIETNLVGYMNGAHAALPIFKIQGFGTIINNISIGGFMPVPYGAGYSASKIGMRGFSEALKGELSAWPNIHICDLFPAFLDTPGVSHAANYTGKKLLPAPPVYDPVRVAQAMVKLAADPRSTVYVGTASYLLKIGRALFPELLTKITGAVIRRYLNHSARIAKTDGNLFTTVDYGMSTHGGFGLPGRPKAHRKYIAGALVAGVAIGWTLFRNSKNKF
jgi:short-subunit dehydrogenase